MRRKPEVLLAAFLAAIPPGARAADVQVGNAWFRALPAGLPAAGYFVLRNTGRGAATLTAAQSPACGMLMLHQSTSENGTSSMSELSGVVVPAHGRIAFAPGGYHLMCMNPDEGLSPGKHVPVTLEFADGTKVNADFTVKNARGK